MTEYPTVYVPVLKYPFGHSLSTISIEEASHHPFVMSYPAPAPHSHPHDQTTQTFPFLSAPSFSFSQSTGAAETPADLRERRVRMCCIVY